MLRGAGAAAWDGAASLPWDRAEGWKDGQTDRLPAQLCLRGLSYHLLLGEGSSQLIQILLPRRQEGVKISAEPVSTSPPGFCARQVQEFNKAGAAGEAAPPLPRTCGELAAGGDTPLMGGSTSQLTKVTQVSKPCRAPLKDGEGVGSESVGFSTGSTAQGPYFHVTAAMAMCHWERPLCHCCPLSQEGSVGRLAHGTGAAGQSVSLQRPIH